MQPTALFQTLQVSRLVLSPHRLQLLPLPPHQPLLHHQEAEAEVVEAGALHLLRYPLLFLEEADPSHPHLNQPLLHLEEAVVAEVPSPHPHLNRPLLLLEVAVAEVVPSPHPQLNQPLLLPLCHSLLHLSLLLLPSLVPCTVVWRAHR